MKKVYKRKDLLDDFLLTLQFYVKDGALCFLETVNDGDKLSDFISMRLFGEAFAWSDSLDEKDRDGLRQFCLTFIESDTERRAHDSQTEKIKALRNRVLEK